MFTSVTVVTPFDIVAAKGKKYITKRESIVARAISREVPKEKSMEKSFDLRYAQGIVEFKTRLALDLQKGTEAKGRSVIVNIEPGRKFEKVTVGFIAEGKGHKVTLDARYFVDKKDGAIYGPKSPLSPNLNHFYGTIYDCQKWDWSGEVAKPYDMEAAGVVKLERGYGEYIHYVRKGAPQPVRRQKVTTVAAAAVGEPETETV